MFVQHMVASLKSDGKMAIVMPHGVLFRGGEEKDAAAVFIKDGILEAVIGLPAGLFYGTGIPACVLVINKQDAANRKHVFFINADREYKEGKAQNLLRPEDISRIVHAYRTLTSGERDELPAYARRVPSKRSKARTSTATSAVTWTTRHRRSPTTCGRISMAGCRSARSTHSETSGQTTPSCANVASGRGRAAASTWISRAK